MSASRPDPLPASPLTPSLSLPPEKETQHFPHDDGATSLDFPSENREDGGEGEEEDPEIEPSDIPSPTVHTRPRTFIRIEFAHQVPNADPAGKSVGFGFWNTVDEQMYYREAKVGQEWKQIDAGWYRDLTSTITDPATGQTSEVPVPITFLMVNEEGVTAGRIPTREEIDQIAGRIIEVGWATAIPSPVQEDPAARKRGRTMWDEPLPPSARSSPSVNIVQEAFAWVPPGEPFLLNPTDISRIYLRCVRGTARYSLRIVGR